VYDTGLLIKLTPKGIVFSFLFFSVYEDDKVLCNIATCPKLVTTLGVPSERVICCCAGVDLYVNMLK